MAAGLQRDPVGTVLHQQHLGIVPYKKGTGSHMHGKGPPRGEPLPLREQLHRLREQRGLLRVTLEVGGKHP